MRYPLELMNLKMADGSSITVKSGGNLYAWGFISGSGAVLAESGATVYESPDMGDGAMCKWSF